MAKKTNSKTATSAKTVKNTNKKTSRAEVVPAMVKLDAMKSLNKINWKFLSRVALIVVIGLALFLLAKKYRGLVLAGVVNKTPVTRWELNQAMTEQYGKQVFDQLVNDELMKQEAVKMKISVSKEEVADQVKQMTEKVGGEQALKDALSQYGMTQEQLETQLKSFVLQKKIAESLGTYEVTEDEATAYFKQNAASFDTKKFDEVKDQITATLKDQKMQDAFNTWFTDVRTKANVQSYF